MNRYWTRIGLGALIVFCLGMTGIFAVRKGTAEVKSLLTAAGTRIPHELTNLKFRFDGRSLGDITALELSRNGRDDVGKVRVRVALNEVQDLDVLRDCALTLDDASGRADRLGFRCASSGELESGDFVKLGEVTFDPGSVTRPLYLMQHDAGRWRRSGVESLDVSLLKDGAGGVEARGNFDVRDHNGSPRRGSFSLKADPNAAAFSVRDDRGRSLVDFSAGAGGVQLNIRDREGRNLIRLLADSVGAAIQARHR